MMAIKGACLCGAVTFEISEPLSEISYCHCTMCQKAHGAAFGPYGHVAWEDFRLLSGAEQIRDYQSSEKITRTFCGTCGATLQFVVKDRAYFGIAMGVIEGDPGGRPSSQIFVKDAAPWHPVQDGIPCYDEFEP